MQFTDRFKRRFSLAEQANIGKENISIFDLRLRALTVDPGTVSPFDEITLAQCAAYKRKTAWSNKSFIGEFNDDFLHSMHLSSMV